MRFQVAGRWLGVRFRPDLGAWCMEVDGAPYLMGGRDVEHEAATFLREQLLNAEWPARPAAVAARRFPLLATVDGTVIRCWPGFVPRERPGWSKTYENPATGIRVLAVKDAPCWWFETDAVSASSFGRADRHDSAQAVRVLAAAWLTERESTT